MCSDSKPYAIVAVCENLKRQKICEELKNEGFQVFEAKNSAEARALIEELELMVEVVFTDLKLLENKFGGSNLAQYCERS